MGVPLDAVTDWTCCAPGPGGDQCGRRHRFAAKGWQLFQVRPGGVGQRGDAASPLALAPRPGHPQAPPPLLPVQCQHCGTPRWEGPGWQQDQRLAAALQAGAALGAALLPPHGADAPAAAAEEATAAALARFRWEAAGAAAAGERPPPDADGSDGEAAGGWQAAALPELDSKQAFGDLTRVAATMLAESRESGAGAARGGCSRLLGLRCCSCPHQLALPPASPQAVHLRRAHSPPPPCRP